MSLYGADRHRISSRRGKKHATDGSVPGIDYNRYRRGAGYADGGNLADRVPLPEGTPAKEYDPVSAEYPISPGYGPPEPWDAIELEPRMPQIRFEFPGRRPKPVRYRNALMSEALFDAVLDRFVDRPQPPATLEQIPFDHDLRATQPLTIDDAAAVGVPPPIGFDQVIADAAMMPTEAPLAMEAEIASAVDGVISLGAEPESPIASESATELPMAALDSMASEPLDAMADSFATTLDTLVEQMMPEPALPQPEEPDPYQLMNQAFNQQMQLMDPFNMMGPMG